MYTRFLDLLIERPYNAMDEMRRWVYKMVLSWLNNETNRLIYLTQRMIQDSWSSILCNMQVHVICKQSGKNVCTCRWELLFNIRDFLIICFLQTIFIKSKGSDIQIVAMIRDANQDDKIINVLVSVSATRGVGSWTFVTVMGRVECFFTLQTKLLQLGRGWDIKPNQD